MDTNITQLAAYAKQQLDYGRLEGVIKNELAQKGWSEEDIDSAFQLVWQQSHSDFITSAGTSPQSESAAGASPVQRMNGGRKQRLILGIGLIVGAPLLFFGVILLLSSGSGQQPDGDNSRPPTQNNAASSEDAANKRREQDAKAIIEAVGTYAELTGFSPQTAQRGSDNSTVRLCDPSCDAATASSVKLRYYKAADVFVKGYLKGLAAPPDNQLYVVTAAVCNAKKDGVVALNAKDDPTKGVAIWYVKNQNGKATRHCLPL